MKPFFSIIVPNFNHDAFLEKRLESIFHQTFKDVEVILLDDHSTDESWRRLNKYVNHPKVSHVQRNDRNSGSPFIQWKNGIELAKGRFIWIAESDDYCDHTFLEEMFNIITKANDDLGLLYAQSTDVGSSGEYIADRLSYTSDFVPNIWEANFILSGNNFVKEYLKVKNVIPNASAVVFKRELIDKTTFTEDLLAMKMCGDWFFWIKLCLKSDIGFVSSRLNYFRSHSAISRWHFGREKKLNRLREEMRIRYYLQTEIEVDQRKEVKKIYNSLYKIFKITDIFSFRFYSFLNNTLYNHLKFFIFHK